MATVVAHCSTNAMANGTCLELPHGKIFFSPIFQLLSNPFLLRVVKCGHSTYPSTLHLLRSKIYTLFSHSRVHSCATFSELHRNNLRHHSAVNRPNDDLTLQIFNKLFPKLLAIIVVSMYDCFYCLLSFMMMGVMVLKFVVRP